MAEFSTNNNSTRMVSTSTPFEQALTPDQLQRVVSDLYSQVQQHSTLFQELQQLKEKIFSLENDNKALTDENALLRHQLLESQQKSTSNPERGEKQSATALNTTNSNGSSSSQSLTPKMDYSAAASKFLPAQKPARISLKRRVAAARLFKTPESRGPQGFQYVYIGRSRKILRSEVRSRLRRAGVDTGRILDICFPASGVLGLLLHVQYVPEFTEIMKKVGADIVDNFEPTDPKNLADPKFLNDSEEQRANQMLHIVHERALDTLQHLSPLQVGPVARTFVEYGWIDSSDAEACVLDAKKRLSKADPKKAEFLFRFTSGQAASDEEAVESDMEL